MDHIERKRQINILKNQITVWSKVMVELEKQSNVAQTNVDGLMGEIGNLQRDCVHTFIGKKSGFMGRGTCEICGKSDY